MGSPTPPQRATTSEEMVEYLRQIELEWQSGGVHLMPMILHARVLAAGLPPAAERSEGQAELEPMDVWDFVNRVDIAILPMFNARVMDSACAWRDVSARLARALHARGLSLAEVVAVAKGGGE